MHRNPAQERQSSSTKTAAGKLLTRHKPGHDGHLHPQHRLAPGSSTHAQHLWAGAALHCADIPALHGSSLRLMRTQSQSGELQVFNITTGHLTGIRSLLGQEKGLSALDC